MNIELSPTVHGMIRCEIFLTWRKNEKKKIEDMLILSLVTPLNLVLTLVKKKTSLLITSTTVP